LARLKPSLSKLLHERDVRAYIIWLGGRGRSPLRGLCRFPGGQECAPQCWRARRPPSHSCSHTVASKDARLAPYCNRVPRLRAGTRPGPFTRAKAALVQDDNSEGFVLIRLKPSPFKAKARAGTLAPTLPSWADEGVRPNVDCADFHADNSVRLNVGGLAPSLHRSSHSVSSKDARLAPYCNRIPRLRAGTRPGPSPRAKAALVQDDNSWGFMLARAEAEPFQS